VGRRTRSGRGCLNCGRPIAQAGERGSEERKTVTVAFCGLIEHYQGTVDKFVGDAVIGVFGAPTSHEDDPERGVRAALSINEAIGELNERFVARRFEARIGLATGRPLSPWRLRSPSSSAVDDLLAEATARSG